ncbi:unnamed protein product [Chilo suppressalis]|uniref:Uncharacterized protein n=1 Tax=Chilo suppressalis TaxID=168631 RepID=A0ABN8BAP6_CHISP|nr:unnamed protein product [Chilo suppressalis]
MTNLTRSTTTDNRSTRATTANTTNLTRSTGDVSHDAIEDRNLTDPNKPGPETQTTATCSQDSDVTLTQQKQDITQSATQKRVLSLKATKHRSKTPTSQVMELPAWAEDVTDMNTFVSAVTKLTQTINKAVNDGKSVTVNNKKVIAAAAQEIMRATQVLAKTSTDAPSSSSSATPLIDPAHGCGFDKESLMAAIREGIREELKTLPTSSPSPPLFTKNFAAAVAARPKCPSRTLLAIIIKSTETGENQPTVYDKWK